jgi:O-antigen/teichoic acid export membrane protein
MPTLTLFSKLVRGASINVVEHGLKVVAMFVTTPLMILHLGKETYGTWLLAIAIIAYFRMLDLGVSFAGSRFLGAALGADDREEYQSLVCNLFRIFIRVGLAALALTVLATWALPLFIKDPGTAATVRILVAGFGVATALRFFTRIFEVMLKSHVRYDLIGISSILKTILQAGLVIGLLLAGYGLMTLLVVHILIDVFDQLLLVFFARRVEADLCLRGSCDGKVRTGELLRYSATAMATTAGHSSLSITCRVVRPVRHIALEPGFLACSLISSTLSSVVISSRRSVNCMVVVIRLRSTGAFCRRSVTAP